MLCPTAGCCFFSADALTIVRIHCEQSHVRLAALWDVNLWCLLGNSMQSSGRYSLHYMKAERVILHYLTVPSCMKWTSMQYSLMAKYSLSSSATTQNLASLHWLYNLDIRVWNEPPLCIHLGCHNDYSHRMKQGGMYAYRKHCSVVEMSWGS